MMQQRALYPTTLAALVDQVKYKPGWSFTLGEVDRGQGSHGLTLNILITTPDSYNPNLRRCVMHFMPVPPAAFNEQSWRRWLFEQILLVETHEAMEFFQLGDGRPFAPNHGPGHNPYSVRELTTDEDRRTSFLGEMNPT